MQRIAYSLSLFTLLLTYGPTAIAAAWTQGAGNAYISHSTTSYINDSFYDLKGNVQAQPRFFKLEQNIYAEYGVTDDFTIGANLFLQYLYQQTFTTIDVSPTLSVTYEGGVGNIGLGDPEAFARYLLFDDDHSVLSLQPLIKLPSYYVYDRLPKGGSSKFDAELSLLAGHSFELANRYHYVDARIGYRHRFHDDLNDQIKADVKLGISIADQWQVIPALYLTLSDDLPSNARFTQSGQNDYDLLKLECSLLYKLRHNMSFYSTVFAHIDGKNTGRGAGVTFGTGLQF